MGWPTGVLFVLQANNVLLTITFKAIMQPAQHRSTICARVKKA
jgi:hypothetical protein